MIEVSQLTKRYGRLTAVDGLSFRVGAGEVLGLLGPNGAGKSTTMRVIAGFLAPTAGTAAVCGHDVGREPLAARAALGYLPEGAPAWGEMTVRGFLGFVADLRRLTGARRRERLDLVTGRLGLEPVLDQEIDTLSKGFRRRVGLAQAILHDPPALILDEPTDGLDPNQKHEVRLLIRELGCDRTVIVSTHILEEVHAVCSRAIIVAAGRLLADDTPAGLEARSRYHGAVTLGFADPAEREAASQAIAALEGVAELDLGDDGTTLTALPRRGAEPFAAIQGLVAARRWRITGLQRESGRLDEVFRTITGGAGRG
jgi:ABC-2 type transport system ATP-binding protein